MLCSWHYSPMKVSLLLIMPDKVRPDAAWAFCRNTNGEGHHIDAAPAASLTTVKNSQKLAGLERAASNLVLFATLFLRRHHGFLPVLVCCGLLNDRSPKPRSQHARH